MNECRAGDITWYCDYDKNDYIKKGDAVKGLEMWIEDRVEDVTDEAWNKGIEACINEIKHHVPPADVVKVRHAYDMDEYTSLFECSNCGWTCDDTYCGEPCVGNRVTYNYCPNCGAKIDYKIGYGERKE